MKEMTGRASKARWNSKKVVHPNLIRKIEEDLIAEKSAIKNGE